MQRPAQILVQTPPAKTPGKSCAGCTLCAAGRVPAPQPIKISGGRTLGPQSLLARCVGG